MFLKTCFLKIYIITVIFFLRIKIFKCVRILIANLHLSCVFLIKKNYYYHYMYNYFQECSGSLCKRVGQRRGEWEECFMTVSGHLTIQKREQLCYLACSKYCPHHVLIGKYRTVKNNVN